MEQPEERLREVAPEGLLNVGIGEDLTINELAKCIREIVGGSSVIAYDRSKPDGTPRKLLDVRRMRALGWEAKTPLREGIRRTYDWYREHESRLVSA